MTMMRYIESRIGGVQKIRCLVGGQVVRLMGNAERVTYQIGRGEVHEITAPQGKQVTPCRLTGIC